MIWKPLLQRKIAERMRPGRRYTVQNLASLVDADPDDVYLHLCRLAEEGEVERVRDRKAFEGVSWQLTDDRG